MSFALETRTDVPAIVVTLHANFDATVDMPQITREFTSLIASMVTPIFLVVDFRAAINRADMNNIQMGAFLATQADTPVFNHPDVREIIFVSVSDVMKLVVEGLRTPTYGSLNVTLVKDLDEVLELIRGRLD